MANAVMMAPPGKLPHPAFMVAPGAPGGTSLALESPAPGGPPQEVLDVRKYTQPIGQVQSSMKVHVPLAKARVLYIGTSVPTVTSKGLDAVQQPINDRYQTNGVSMTEMAGIDAWLSVFSSGMLLQYVGDTSGSMSWFPIHSLHLGTAVKCSPQLQLPTGQIKPNCNFGLVDSATVANSEHPPIFAAIMRRQTGVKTLECHSFICKSNLTAMALVQSVYHAYEHKEGWLEEAPPKEMYDEQDVSFDTSDPNAIPETPIFRQTNEGKDRPPAKGYFLNSKSNLVKMFDVNFPNNLSYMRQTHMMTRQAMPARFVPEGIRPHALKPPVPSNYFSDWDAFFGQPMAAFPGPYMAEDEYRRTVRDMRNRRPLPKLPRSRGQREPDYHASYEREIPRERAEHVVVDRRPPRYSEREEYSNQYYRGRGEGLDYVYQGELPQSRGRRYDEPVYESRYLRHIDGDAQRPSRDRRYDFQDTLGYYP